MKKVDEEAWANSIPYARPFGCDREFSNGCGLTD
jgi:hypothetical protein